MADFVQNEAEESEDEIIYRKRKHIEDDDDDDDDEEEEEEDDEDELREEMKDLINDNEEEEDDKEDSDEEIVRKRRKYHEDYDALEEEDYDLIEENLGVKVQRKKKFKRVRRIMDDDSDNEESGEVNDREAIANELFEGNDMECEDGAPQPAANDILIGDLEVSESESEDENDFIVDDDGQPISKAKKKAPIKYTDAALQRAQEIFGVDFDYGDFAQEDKSDEDLDEEYENDEEEDGVERRRQKKSQKKDIKKNLLNFYEPAELERNHLTAQDDEIRLADVPERFLLRGVLVTKADDDEIEEEAEWIYMQAFSRPTLSFQGHEKSGTDGTHEPIAGLKSPSAIRKICEALKFIRNDNFEVPFIAFYRKEYIEPDLNINDLWTIYKWDEKWCQFRNRKMNLCHLFGNMQQYQHDIVMENPDKPLAEGTRALANDDIYRLSKVQSFEEVQDCYAHFTLYYGHDILLMRKFFKLKAQKENKENEIDKEKEPEKTKVKHIPHKDTYTVCKESGIDGLAKKFGLTPEQFGENLNVNYQRHEIEQYPVEPKEVALDYVCKRYPTPEDCLSAAKYMVATQLSREPAVRKCVRQTYFERAKLCVRPTKKGIKEIDENHPCYSIKYLKNKPVKDLHGDQFLKLSMAEKSGLLTTEIVMDKQGLGDGHHVYLDEIKQLYQRDEFSKNVQEWNVVRQQALELALTKFLYPALQKELKLHLLNEAKEGIIKACCRKLYGWLKVAPFQVDPQIEEEEDFDTRNGTRVLSIAYSLGKDIPAFCALIDGDGEVVEYLRLPGLLFRRNSWKEKEREMKEKDLNALRNLMLSKKPHVVIVSVESREARMIAEDVKGIINDLMDHEQFPPITVELINNELGVLYSNSMKGENDFRDYPPLLRQAISNARRLQDPLMEFSQLCTADEEILCLKYHPLQGEVTKDDLLNALYLEFVNRTNEVGVDFNRAIQFPHTANLVQFVCGLGPRKALYYLKTLKTANQRLESRSQLVMKYKMGPKIFMNCSGFIKIDTATLIDSTETFLDVLDGTRIHLETYEWARKMALDALDYDDTSDGVNSAGALEEILENPGKLKDLDLDAFAEELERQGYGNKNITLYDIRAELYQKYKDLRTPYRPPNADEMFNMLTKEVPETFYTGKLVLVFATGIARRKPQKHQLDTANPIRIAKTGLWQCPFCLQKDFPELSDVWSHFDGRCPGQAMGVHVKLDNGIFGFIPTKMLSDKYVENPADRVKIGMTLHGRITKIDIEKLTVDLTSRSSDLSDKNNEWRPSKDLYYDFEAEEKDTKPKVDTSNKQNRQVYLKRVIVHPSFKNVTFEEAEKILKSMVQGDVIIRPSSRGHNHLTVTWKVTESIHQHIDVIEEGKENEFSLGKSLIIGKESFEDLDEIIARHIQPMASFARELLKFQYYTDCNGGKKEEMERLLFEKKKKASNKIHYIVSASRDYPGHFLLSYLPRNKVRHEFITVLPGGFKYRDKVLKSVNRLFQWFKDHMRDPIPGTPIAMPVRTPLGESSNIGNASKVMNVDKTAVQRVAKTLPTSLFNTLSQVTHGQTQAAFHGANNFAAGYSGFDYQASYTPSQHVAPPLLIPSYHAVPVPSHSQIPTPQYLQTPQQNWAHPSSQTPSQATPMPQQTPQQNWAHPSSQTPSQATPMPQQTPQQNWAHPSSQTPSQATPMPQQTPQQNWAHPASQTPSQATPMPAATPRSSVEDIRRLAELWAKRNQENSAANPATIPSTPANHGSHNLMIESAQGGATPLIDEY